MSTTDDPFEADSLGISNATDTLFSNLPFSSVRALAWLVSCSLTQMDPLTQRMTYSLLLQILVFRPLIWNPV